MCSVSGVQAASISYLGEFHGNRTRSKWVTMVIMFMPLALVYQPAVGLLVLPRAWELAIFDILIYRTWRIYILFSSSIVAAGYVASLFLPESPKFELAMGRADEALRILRRVYTANTGHPENTFPVRQIELEEIGSSLSEAHGCGGMLKLLWRQTYPVFRPPFVGNLLMLLYLSVACYVVSHGFYMWAPQILAFYLPRLNGEVTVCAAVKEGIAELVAAAANK